VEEPLQHDRALVIIGAAGPAIAERLALEILDAVDALGDHDGPLRLERLAHDVGDRGSAERRLSASGRDRHEIHVAGQPGRDQRSRLQHHPFRIEPLGFVETTIHGDVARDVKTAAPDRLANPDLIGFRARLPQTAREQENECCR
jgi:hypothetical protein